ncbi:MAG TPA: DUF6263 family protein [Tepidisphaeraceae bacterium]|jgi:hypothetical protein|nr:DUF6263 family protein [Tepidisphaeraceae bacterium]
MKFTAPFLALALLAPFACAQDKLDLRLRFSKGDVHDMVINLDQTIDQTIQNTRQQTTQSITIGYTFTVDDLDDQGTASISVRYKSVAVHSKSQAGEVNYDSTQPGTYVPSVVGNLAALVGQGYSMKIAPSGTVTQVSGLDALLKLVLGKLSIPEGPVRTAAELALKQRLDEQNVKASLASIFAPFPAEPVAIGQSWYHKTQLNLGFPLTVETTYTLKSRDNGMATVELVGRASTAPGSTIDLGQQSKMTYDLQGELHGQIQIQESTGWPWLATTTQTLTGNATVQSPIAPTQVVPITVESKLKTEQK